MTRPRTALVVGSGVAGPAAAMALQKAGIEPTLFEAQATGADGGGVFLTLATNGIDALRVLDADTAALRAGFGTPAITLRSHTGKELGQTRTGAVLEDGIVSQTLKRAVLHQALHEEVLGRGIEIRRGKRLVEAHDTGDRVQARFADGTEADADILVGCDGIHSVVRRMIDPGAARPTYSGLLTTGGYTRDVEVGAEAGRYEMIFGRRAFFGYVAAPDGEVWWYVNLPRLPEPARGEVEAVAEATWRSEMADLFEGDGGPALELVGGTRAFAPMTAIHTLPHLRHWHRGRMVVIGDAAHAPSPTSGQGASLSVEDAVFLAMCLRRSDTAEDAFRRFESERRPRAEGIIKAAARINNSKAPGPVVRVLRDAMLPAVLKMTANARSTREVFDYHLDWDAPSAQAPRKPDETTQTIRR